MVKIAEWMDQVAQHVGDEGKLTAIAGDVKALCGAFPAPGIPQ